MKARKLTRKVRRDEGRVALTVKLSKEDYLRLQMAAVKGPELRTGQEIMETAILQYLERAEKRR